MPGTQGIKGARNFRGPGRAGHPVGGNRCVRSHLPMCTFKFSSRLMCNKVRKKVWANMASDGAIPSEGMYASCPVPTRDKACDRIRVDALSELEKSVNQLFQPSGRSYSVGRSGGSEADALLPCACLWPRRKTCQPVVESVPVGVVLTIHLQASATLGGDANPLRPTTTCANLSSQRPLASALPPTTVRDVQF